MVMEFLNSLWIAISTPNEGLINVMGFFLTFFESTLCMILFLSILNISTNLKSKLLYIFLVSASSTFSLHIIPAPYNMIFNYFIIFTLAKYIFKTKVLKTIVGMTSSLIIFSLVGFLILRAYVSITKLTYEQIETIPIFRFLYVSILYISVLLITIILKIKNFKIILLENLDIKSKLIILCNFILGLITLCIQIFITVYYSANLPLIFTILSFVSLFAYFMLSIYSLTRSTELFKTTQALQNAEEYNKTLRIIHDNVRCFKHDFDNIVTTLGGYIQTDDIEGLKKYYSQLQDDCQRANNLYILNPEVINNPGIYNLLTTKYHEAEEKNIKVNLSFLLDLNKLNMKIYEFTRILGVLLDNSIDAANESDEKIINITFRNEEKNHRQIILIENTYNKDIDISMDKIFDKGVSGKENHTGLGLWEVRKIVKKNNNLNLYTNKDENYFIQQLEIYY